MNCIYCNQECLIDPEAKRAPTGWYKCQPCGTNYYIVISPFETLIDMVDVWTTINGRHYVVRLRPYLDATLILQCEPSDIAKGNYFHHIIFNFNNLMPITPHNVYDKLKTVLTFS